MHKCKSHEEWLVNNHYFCSCGHVQWAHHANGRCAHCICTQYNGEPRPQTEYEKQQEASLNFQCPVCKAEFPSLTETDRDKWFEHLVEEKKKIFAKVLNELAL